MNFPLNGSHIRVFSVDIRKHRSAPCLSSATKYIFYKTCLCVHRDHLNASYFYIIITSVILINNADEIRTPAISSEGSPGWPVTNGLFLHQKLASKNKHARQEIETKIYPCGPQRSPVHETDSNYK